MTQKVSRYFLKKPPEKTIMVQARIPIALVKSLKPFMKKHSLTWTRLVTGALQTVLDQGKGKKK